MKHFTIATAGHVDHGKTSLIKALTGIDLDSYAEEKKRGITINNGYTHLILPSGNQAGIIDVPGHQNFIHNMIAGASACKLALLVIAADSGPEVQTMEHLQILEILGIEKIIPVFTRIDLVSEDDLEISQIIYSDSMKNSAIENTPISFVSAKTGQGLDELKLRIEQELEKLNKSDEDAFFKLWVDRSFSIKGHGTVITGSVYSGTFALDQELWLYPGKESLKVKGLQRHGQDTEIIETGDRAAINLQHIDCQSIQRGMLISDSPLQSSLRIDARFTSFAQSKLHKRHFHARLYTGSLGIDCKIHILDQDEILPQQDALIQIHFDQPITVQVGEKFILRDAQLKHSLGGGTFIDTQPLHHRRRKEKSIQALQKINEKGLLELLANKLNESDSFLSRDELSQIAAMPAEHLEKNYLGENIRSSQYLKLGNNGYLCKNSFIKDAGKTIHKEIRLFFANDLLREQAVSLDELSGKIHKTFRKEVPKDLLRFLCKKLVEANKIQADGANYLPSEELNLDKKKLLQDINTSKAWFTSNAQNTASVSVLAKEIKMNAESKEFSRLLKHFIRQDFIVQVDECYLLKSVVDSCRELMLDYLKAGHLDLTVAKMRDLIQANRRTVLHCFALFEQNGLIYRDGDIRKLITKM